jgi:hypothetical protein
MNYNITPSTLEVEVLHPSVERDSVPSREVWKLDLG